MRKILKTHLILILVIALSLQACSREADNKVAPENAEQAEILDIETHMGILSTDTSNTHFVSVLSDLSERVENEQTKKSEEEERNPYKDVPPDESGKVMIIMFHSFIEVYEEGDNADISTTLADFRALLEQLYNAGYRTASLSDFIDGNIKVQRGCKPIIFTFDDGRRSQFSFIENDDGSIIENPNTGVAVMEQFYKEHPDFGLNGTFFLNLGFSGTFGTVGTLQQRLQAMKDKGFELENHTYNHANLSLLNTPEEVMEEIGKNSKTLNELLPGSAMSILALPYGNTNKSLEQYIAEGSYEGFEYRNRGIMLVGAEPSAQMYLKDSDPIKIRRILASGIFPVECDFEWWFNLEGKHEFISDGNPNLITVPFDKLDLIDEQKVQALGKELVVID